MSPRPHVVVIGAGFGGLAVARRMERASVDVTVVDRHNYHTFQPLLYQVATSGLNAADVGYAVRGVFRRQKRIRFRKAQVAGVDLDARTVDLRDLSPLGYDYLVVAAGSRCNTFDIPGADELAFPLYTLEDAVRLRNHVVSLFEAASADPSLVDDGVLTFVVVGGGPTGVEVAGALAELVEKVFADDFHDLDVRRARVVLLEQGDRLLSAFSATSSRYALRALERRGVEVRLGTGLASVAADHAELVGGEVLRTRALVWAAGVRAGSLADTLGLTQGRGGRISVHRDLSVPGYPEVFAIGDIADIDDGNGGRLPQLAQVAIQGGHHAAEQIVATIERRDRADFSYLDKGTMATIGRRSAVAELPMGLELHGMPAWVAWLVLHLVYLVGVRNRVSVMINWAWNYLTWDRGPRLILRPEVLPHTPIPHSDADRRGSELWADWADDSGGVDRHRPPDAPPSPDPVTPPPGGTPRPSG